MHSFPESSDAPNTRCSKNEETWILTVGHCYFFSVFFIVVCYVLCLTFCLFVIKARVDDCVKFHSLFQLYHEDSWAVDNLLNLGTHSSQSSWVYGSEHRSLFIKVCWSHNQLCHAFKFTIDNEIIMIINIHFLLIEPFCHPWFW